MSWNLFHGRYGIDKLSVYLMLLSVILIGNVYTLLIGILFLVFAIYRMFSRNINRRYMELQYFNRLMEKVVAFFTPLYESMRRWFERIKKKAAVIRTRYSQRKTHVFVKCKVCKNTLRLPKGKGKLKVTCPVCKNEFFKKT